MTVLIASLIVLGLGVSLFLYGQALGVLLVSDCPDFASPGLTQRCAQPRYYLITGIVVSLVGLTGAAGSGYWLVLRRAKKEVQA